MNRPRRGPESGFTFIEFSIVVVIVVFLLGGLVAPLASQLALRDNKSTTTQLENIKNLLVSFALANGRLPCPDSIGGAGWEDATCDLLTEGYLPWATLGAPWSTSDAWGKRFRYRVESSYTGRIPTPALTTNGIVVELESGIPLTDVDPNGAVAVVFSCGKNGLPDGKNDRDGVTNASDDCSNPGTPDAYFGTYVQNAFANPDFDDLLVVVSNSVLMGRLGATRNIPPTAGGGGGAKVTLCHNGTVTVSLSPTAAAQHYAVHGDTPGACP